MIKTIKVKKTKNLSELIAYISESGIKDANFVSNYENIVSVDHSGQITTAGKFYNDTFTVEVEETITDYTAFQNVVIIVLNGINHMPSTNHYSIRSIRRDYPTVTEIHTLINGKLELIWEAE